MANELNDKPVTTESNSALRDALTARSTGDGGTRVTPTDIGHNAPEENSLLARDLSLGGPSYLDRAIFCRQLATLIEIGIPMLKALQMLSTRTSNGQLRNAVREAAVGVEQGEPIHVAMGRNTRVFSPMVINIIKIGEQGGILENSLVRLAEIMETRAMIKRKVIAALMYPTVAVIVAIIVVSIIMIKAIPVFAEIYKDSGTELPAITQLVIGISSFMAATWWILAIILVGLFFAAKVWGRTSGGNRVYSWLSLQLPIFRGVTRKVGTARFCRTLGSLLVAGVPLVDALRISADTNENVVIADALRGVHAHVERGERMSPPLARAGVFPPLVVDMISIGEETGTLDRMLEKISDIYEAEVDSTLTGLSSIIEPILIVVLGGVVMFIALSVLLPYFNLVNVTEQG